MVGRRKDLEGGMIWKEESFGRRKDLKRMNDLERRMICKEE
jgi:hypothetical protein